MAELAEESGVSSTSTAVGLRAAQMFSAITLSPAVFGRRRRVRLGYLPVFSELFISSMFNSSPSEPIDSRLIEFLENTSAESFPESESDLAALAKRPVERRSLSSIFGPNRRLETLMPLLSLLSWITDTVPLTVARYVWAELTDGLSQFAYFGMPLALSESAEPTVPWRHYMGRRTLILNSDLTKQQPAWSRQHLALLDPTPPVQYALSHLDYWPGLLVWDARGHSALLPNRVKLPENWVKIRLEAERHAQRIPIETLRDWAEKAVSEPDAKRVLQLSDLHVEKVPASKNRHKIFNLLDRDLRQTIDRIAITGDFVHNPTSDAITEARLAVQALRLLQADPKQDVIVIPGNHDVRPYGNRVPGVYVEGEFRNRFQRKPVVIDDKARIVFLNYDSTLSGKFAQGEVPDKYLDDMDQDLANELQVHADAKDYFRIALVHHHPVKYSQLPKEKTPTGGWNIRRKFKVVMHPWQSMQNAYHTAYAWITDRESLLKMVNGEGFLKHCQQQQVKLVLHGHKHRERRTWWAEQIHLVGCGASLGIEGKPSYVLLELHSGNKAWFVRFFEYEEAEKCFVNRHVETDRFVN